MKTQSKSLVEIFFETLKAQEIRGVIEYEFYDLYTRLFTILSTDILEAVLHNAYVDRKENHWFADFHKGMRQGDLFDGCYLIKNDPQIKKEDQQELNKLNKELELALKKLDKFENKERVSIPPTTDPTYVQKQAEFDVKYKMYSKQVWPDEKRSRRRALLDLVREESKKSIDGHMDMILHSIIGIDTKEVLYNSMLRTFNEFEFQKKLTKKKKAEV